MTFCGPKLSLTTLISGFIFGVLGCLLKIFLPDIIQSAIMKNLVLSETSVNYASWVEPPFPLYTNIFLFNYTNAREFVETWEDDGTKPTVQQIGPYVYRISRRKKNITFISEDEVEFYVTKEMTFVPEMSNGTEQDMVTFPNIVLRTVAHSNRTRQAPADAVGLFLVPGIKAYPFLTKSVGDLLFNGFHDPIIAFIRKNDQTVTSFTDDNFSLMKKVTETGPVRVKTGSHDISQYGQVVEYNNKTVLDVWPKDTPCNLIRGTDGSMFPPNLPKDKRIYLFSGDLCRTMFLRFEREVDHYGVKANRFVLDPDTMANTNPEYECFCKSPMNKCWGSGVFNVGQCRNDSQIMVSLPHLYNTDYRIKNAIDGLAPDPENQQFFFDIEPTTGVPLKVSSNIQLNIGAEPPTWLPPADNLPEIILPILWMNDGMTLNETLTAMLKAKVIDGPLMITCTIPVIVMGVGVLLGALGILCSVYYMFKGKKTIVKPFNEKSPAHAFSD